MRDPVRVALLARPGAGADRLRAALGAAGADLVLDADPTTLEPAALSAAGAQSVVVLLDAAVEDALDRLDPVLHDPAIDVLYEESEVAAAREGWDVARWTRHVSAKLLRHGDVLPPGREADAAPPPRMPPPEAPPGLAPALAPEAAIAMPPVSEPEPEPEFAPAPDVGPLAGLELAPEPEPESASLSFDPVAAEYEFVATPDSDPGVPAFPALAELDFESSEPEPGEAPPDLASTDVAPPAPPAPMDLSLADDATPIPAVPVPAAENGSDAIRGFRRNLADIEKRIASMELVDEQPASAPAAPAAGAVLVLAGIGGPDAVRQFLGELPPHFPRPVLVQQRLDGGRHDRLVQQMARATSLPVRLAVEGDLAMPGHVYILPPDLGLAATEGALRFVAGGNPITSLPPADSAVLMFSGSDTALVDAAMDHAQAGALVAGQSPEDCYDAAASDALVARGAESGQPAELARRLADRWAA